MCEDEKLTKFVKNVADAIREVEGSSNNIIPNEFPERIKNLSGSSGFVYDVNTENETYVQSADLEKLKTNPNAIIIETLGSSKIYYRKMYNGDGFDRFVSVYSTENVTTAYRDLNYATSKLSKKYTVDVYTKAETDNTFIKQVDGTFTNISCGQSNNNITISNADSSPSIVIDNTSGNKITINNDGFNLRETGFTYTKLDKYGLTTMISDKRAYYKHDVISMYEDYKWSNLYFPKAKSGTLALTSDIPTIVANPTDAGTTDLTKLKVGDTIYNVSGGGGGEVATLQSQVESIINGTQVVGKASKDADGNVITETYATKAALATTEAKAQKGVTDAATAQAAAEAAQTTADAAVKTTDFETFKTTNTAAITAAKKAGDDAQAALDEYKTANDTALAGKQDKLTADQLNAVNSGVTKAKVITYDDYASKITTLEGKPGLDKVGTVTSVTSTANGGLKVAGTATAPTVGIDDALTFVLDCGSASTNIENIK